jgi:plasmid stabilization system protein ParE
MARYRLVPSARKDLLSIRRYLRMRSADAWQGVHSELRAAFQLLAERPGIGHARPDMPERVRVWSVYSYLIVYDPEPRPIRIVRIIHGARDVPRLTDSP